jgi:hypothetical protein
MSNQELEYLRFIYRNLDVNSCIYFQNTFSGIIPENYYLSFCQSCEKNISIIPCSTCNKKFCTSCTNYCQSSASILCKEHFLFCSICRLNCACTACRKYNPDKICDICADNFEVPYSCANCSKNEEEELLCIFCKKQIEPIIGLRINS